mmetsp:Transcript_76057/g.215537  ORF Transcript_76057/g.215537 Transcript_76057/m.215537 type:complete len:250 (+) Transcript_76057:957-1706(+)
MGGLRVEHLAEGVHVLRHDVPDPPGLVLRARLHHREDLRLPLRAGLQPAQRHAVGDREYAHGLLLVLAELLERLHQLGQHRLLRQDRRHLAEHTGGLSAHHGRVVTAEARVGLQQVVLLRPADLRKRHGEQPASGHAGREPVVRAGEPADQGAHVPLHLRVALQVHLPDQALQRAHGLLADRDLLLAAQLLQRGGQGVSVPRPADPGHSPAQLLRERRLQLVLVVEDVLQERQKLLARPFGPERRGDRA